MATPPFDIMATVPGDNDIASVYPAAERSFRDTVNSWLLVDGNTNGGKEKISFNPQASEPTGVAGVQSFWYSEVGVLLTKYGTGTSEVVGSVTGEVKMFAGSTLPGGFLWCDGSAVSRSTYARLFTAIGAVYGTGDGSTTFNVPNMGGRTGVGYEATPTILPNFPSNTLGATFGEENHFLSTSELPAHNHPTSENPHSHNVTASKQSAAAGQITSGAFFAQNQNIASDGATTGLTVGNTGSNAGHNNVQPSMVLNYIIRY